MGIGKDYLQMLKGNAKLCSEAYCLLYECQRALGSYAGRNNFLTPAQFVLFLVPPIRDHVRQLVFRAYFLLFAMWLGVRPEIDGPLLWRNECVDATERWMLVGGIPGNESTRSNQMFAIT